MHEAEIKYQYSGAGALVKLHGIHLSGFLNTWEKAFEKNIQLPATDDPDYVSLKRLLKHVLTSARGYLVWICKNLQLADPEIKMPPSESEIEKDARDYMKYLFEKWSTPLIHIPEDKFFEKEYSSNWGVDYCIDAMLEHAVMHPIRHQFQLQKILDLNLTG